ncbi:VIT domain-containing protein [Paraliomyxa miuraensis]|uniref:VIT domain-containing protein n=1 Tax=Paraliomyxa miuraensis TaxID=376150 RepID=UPI00225988C0|nr:VIT domain-containing protein [Paraliomyxa miuraensis]MCX4247572.1 VIT domain-containing protein [Paraliomyxa miuraensis]
MSRSFVVLVGRLVLCGLGILVLPACRTAPLFPTTLDPAPALATDPSEPQVHEHEHEHEERRTARAADRLGRSATSPAWTGPDEPEDGLYARTAPGSLPELCDAKGVPLPLRHTDVQADLRGHVAEVRVRQTFHNAAKRPIEVVYTFPLPENSAVADMRMTIGERTIHSEVHERKAARNTYEHARAQGHTAALLEQERPNIFTHSVANIAPGEDVEVELRYLQTLTYDEGAYEYVFPMVVGPRFMPGEPTGRPQSGTGTHLDTTVVPDAARISPPILGHGERDGDDISISVTADAGLPIVSWSAPTHDVVAQARDGRLSLALARHDSVPNRDFVLRYRVAGAEPRATAFFGPTNAKGDGHYLMIAYPPHADVDAEVGRRELVFVVDRSGSMSGEPLALAKQTVRELLSHLRPVDTFDVVGFASGTERLFGRPRPANAENLVTALAFIDEMVGGGGTMMNDAVQASLSDEVARGFNRYVLFLTDGYVGNEDQILAGARGLVERIARRGQVARVFGIGIGSSPNRYLIDGLAEAGNGAARTITHREEPSRVVNATLHDIDRPALTELRLPEGSGLEVESFPSTIPDLFVSHPVVVVGRYHGRPPQSLALHAKQGRRHRRIPVEIQRTSEDDRTMSTLWARAKVDELEARLWSGHDEEAVDEITALGLQHHMVTAYTSLVAVDRSRRVGNGRPSHVVQPTHAPEGVDVEMAGGVSVGRTVAMEEFRNIPIGNGIGRDFTQVVESSAMALGDSAGISLAGTTGAESNYQVEVVQAERVAKVRTAPERALDLELKTDGPMPPGRPQAHVAFGRVRAETSRSTAPLRAALRKSRGRLRQCFESSPMFEVEGQAGNKTLVIIELTVDAQGELSARVVHGTLRDAKADRCLEHAITEAPWALSPGTVLQLPLTLWAD